MPYGGHMLDIKLPIQIRPIVRCRKIHAYLINIMNAASNNNFEKYIICNYLCLHNGVEKICRNYLDFHLSNNYLNIVDVFKDNSWFDIIQVNKIDTENDRTNNYIKEILIQMLHAGYFVLQNVNEGLFPHSFAYGNSVAPNVCMLYGYNEYEDRFYILDYDKYGHFGSCTVSSEEYFGAVSSVPNRNRFDFIKVKDTVTFSFDFEHSINLLQSQIGSFNAYPDHLEYQNHIFGYASIERSLHEAEKGQLSISDFRAILEHKDVLSRYFQYVTQNLNLVDDYFYNYYKEINEKMHQIFMKIIKKSLSYSTENIFSKECDAIRRINEEEAALINKYVSNIAERKM